VGIHWFGQSSYALKDAAGTIVVLDPHFPKRRPPDRFIRPRAPLEEADLRTDFVLLTHDHLDHTCAETLGRIAAAHPAARFVGPAASIEHVQRSGIRADLTVRVEAGHSAALGTLEAHAVWAKPRSGAPEDGINPPDTTHLGYVVDAGGVRVYVSGDPINTFAEHDELIKPIRLLRPDIGLMTNHPSEGEFPFFEGSAKSAARIGLKTAVPAHYDCFVERTYDPRDWARHVERAGVKPLIIDYDTAIVYPCDHA
jgi:L-ascorbate metabolism protein UlaG (beta-lactamase superfamily)